MLRDLEQRGLEVPHKRAVGDSALGFWAALDEVYPARHLPSAVLGAQDGECTELPAEKRAQPKAKRAAGDLDGSESEGGGGGSHAVSADL